MTLRIVRSTDAAAPEIRAFNARLASAGSSWRFYEEAMPDWLAAGEGAPAWREYFLAEDDKDGAVRGGFVLKQQAFMLHRRPVVVGNVQGPVSEGIISRRFAALGAVMMKHALARQPLQIGWGASPQKAQLLAQAGWTGFKFPLLLHVVRKGKFLRQSSLFKGRPDLDRYVKALAATGLAQAGLGVLQGGLALPSLGAAKANAVEEPDFGAWADDVWDQALAQYSLVAVRDRAALSCVMPRGAWPDVAPLRVEQDGRTLGWAAVRIRQAQGDAMFGDLLMGSVVDMLSLPGREQAVAAAAAAYLRRRGVDMIGAAASHPRWVRAFRDAGFVPLNNRRHFAMSPALMDAAGEGDALVSGLHMTLIDGDGPRVF